MNRPQLTFVAALIACLPAIPCLAQKTPPQFHYEQFPAAVYHGKLRTPPYLRKTAEGWEEADTGRAASAPRVTFAGEYLLSAYTCGTCCRFYMMTNMRTGYRVRSVGMFDTGDTQPVTKDGHHTCPFSITGRTAIC